jgi:Co/Zn/Cd efflux system component
LFSWARLEILAGLLQEVLLLSLSLSIIVDAINKLINPNHIEDPLVMIYLGSAGVCIGLLGLFLFRGYHHDHNIRNEIVEQKKIDFVQSVCNTLQNLDKNHLDQEQSLIKPKLIINDTSEHLNDRYRKTFVVVDQIEKEYRNSNEQQLSVPDNTSIRLNRMRSKSGESMLSSKLILNQDKIELDDGFQDSRVYATLHALCLHSLVNIFISKINKREY